MTNGDGSGVAFSVVTAEVEESKSQNGSTRESTTSQHMFPVFMVSEERYPSAIDIGSWLIVVDCG